MTFDQAAADALSKGVFGPELLKTAGLDTVPFFASLPWNQSNPSVNIHRQSSGPATHADEGVYDCQDPTTKGQTLEQAFVQLNSRLLRFAKNFCLWTRSEKAKLLAFQASAGALCVTKFQKPDGSWTNPLLLVTGPIATTFHAAEVPLDTPLDLPTWSSKPNDLTNRPRWKAQSATPVAFSMAPDSRISWESVQAKASTRLTTFLAKVPVLVNPDARSLGNYIFVRNPTGSDTSSRLDTSPLIAKQIWVPDIPASASSIGAPNAQSDASATSAWASASDPPPPLSPALWKDTPTALTGPLTVQCTLLDSFSLTDDPVPNAPIPAPRDEDVGGWFLLPQCLALPQGHTLSIGLLVDPNKLEVDTFISIVSGLAPTNMANFYQWLVSPLLHVWLKGVIRRPAPFTAHFLPWDA